MTANIQQTTLAPARTAADYARFEAIWSRNHAAVRGWLTGRTRDRHLAEDLTAEVFLRAWRTLHTVYSPDEDEQGVKNWLYRIARTVLIDHRKSCYARRVEPVDALPEPGHLPSAEDTVLASVESARLVKVVRQAIDALTAPQREAVLGDLGELSAAQTAAAMGRSTQAVKCLLHRGRVQLRRHLALTLPRPADQRVAASAGVA